MYKYNLNLSLCTKPRLLESLKDKLAQYKNPENVEEGETVFEYSIPRGDLAAMPWRNEDEGEFAYKHAVVNIPIHLAKYFDTIEVDTTGVGYTEEIYHAFKPYVSVDGSRKGNYIVPGLEVEPRIALYLERQNVARFVYANALEVEHFYRCKLSMISEVFPFVPKEVLFFPKGDINVVLHIDRLYNRWSMGEGEGYRVPIDVLLNISPKGKKMKPVREFIQDHMYLQIPYDMMIAFNRVRLMPTRNRSLLKGLNFNADDSIDVEVLKQFLDDKSEDVQEEIKKLLCVLAYKEGGVYLNRALMAHVDAVESAEFPGYTITKKVKVDESMESSSQTTEVDESAEPSSQTTADEVKVLESTEPSSQTTEVDESTEPLGSTISEIETLESC